MVMKQALVLLVSGLFDCLAEMENGVGKRLFTQNYQVKSVLILIILSFGTWGRLTVFQS